MIGQNNAWGAIVCIDSQGIVKLAVAVRVAIPDPKHAKTNTILLGLKLAADFRDTSYINVSDAKDLVHWICNKDSVPS